VVHGLFRAAHSDASHPQHRLHTLSSAIAANLSKGRSLEDAILEAIAYLRAGLERGSFPGRGSGVPDHFPDREPRSS
jgi:Hydroxymethylpyrimidine/phosphomethylpyrimidine kinase